MCVRETNSLLILNEYLNVLSFELFRHDQKSRFHALRRNTFETSNKKSMKHHSNAINFIVNFCRFFVPTFDTKITEYLCSGWVFFLQTNFDFLNSHF